MKSQSFGEVTYYEDFLYQNYDGVLGLGPKCNSVIGAPIFANMIRQKVIGQPVFAFYLQQ